MKETYKTHKRTGPWGRYEMPVSEHIKRNLPAKDLSDLMYRQTMYKASQWEQDAVDPGTVPLIVSMREEQRSLTRVQQITVIVADVWRVLSDYRQAEIGEYCLPSEELRSSRIDTNHQDYIDIAISDHQTFMARPITDPDGGIKRSLADILHGPTNPATVFTYWTFTIHEGAQGVQFLQRVK